MSKMFIEGSGLIHLVESLNDEYTSCGVAWTDPGDEAVEEQMTDIKATNKTTVTCPRCIEEIENCRGVRTSK